MIILKIIKIHYLNNFFLKKFWLINNILNTKEPTIIIKMKKIFLAVLYFLICILEQNVNAAVIEKFTLDETLITDWITKNNDNKLRVEKGLAPIEINQKLKEIAQKEADRLAKINKLKKPAFQLSFPYTGFSEKIEGLMKTNGG